MNMLQPNVNIVNSLLHQLLKQKVLESKRWILIWILLQKSQSSSKFWDCIVLPSAFYVAL